VPACLTPSEWGDLAARSGRRRLGDAFRPFAAASSLDAEVDAELRGVGFELEEDLDNTELLARYDPRGVNGMEAFWSSRIAWALVGGGVARRAE
jgi:hypothetical protein